MRGLPLREVNHGLELAYGRFLDAAAVGRGGICLAVAAFDGGGGELVKAPRLVSDLTGSPTLANRPPTGRETLPDLDSGLKALLTALGQADSNPQVPSRHLLGIVLHNRPEVETYLSAVDRCRKFQRKRQRKDDSGRPLPFVYCCVLVVGDTVSPTETIAVNASTVEEESLCSLVERGVVARLRGLMFREALEWMAEQTIAMAFLQGNDPFEPLAGNLREWAHDISRIEIGI